MEDYFENLIHTTKGGCALARARVHATTRLIGGWWLIKYRYVCAHLVRADNTIIRVNFWSGATYSGSPLIPCPKRMRRKILRFREGVPPLRGDILIFEIRYAHRSGALVYKSRPRLLTWRRR